MDFDALVEEIMGYVASIDVESEGERLYSNYQKVTAIAVRLSEIHNQISLMEIKGQASNELRRLRTMIIDPTIERLDKVGSFESRKITAVGYELSLEGKR